MNEKYTEDDILAEAISLHSFAASDLEGGSISGLMETGEVQSTRNDMGDVMTWADLLEDDEAYDEAAKKVREIYDKAADTSEWAVEMGKDGLKPFSGHIDIQVGPARARIMFAFSDEIAWEQQAEFVELTTFKLAKEI